MSEPLHKNHDRYFVPGLHRGLRVLEIVAEADKPLTISEIAQRLGVSRSSAFRIVYTLRHMEFLRPVWGEKAFGLGLRILNLGFAYLNEQDLIKVAKPFLKQLRDETKVSCHLGVREGREVLYLDSLSSRTAFVSNISTGTRTPVYSSPLGWLLLMACDHSEVQELMSGVVFTPSTRHTPADIEALIQRVEQIKSDGFIISRGFGQRGGSMIGAPLYNESGEIIAAIDISGPDGGFEMDRIEEFYLPLVLEAARRVSASLGFKG